MVGVIFTFNLVSGGFVLVALTGLFFWRATDFSFFWSFLVGNASQWIVNTYFFGRVTHADFGG